MVGPHWQPTCAPSPWQRDLLRPTSLGHSVTLFYGIYNIHQDSIPGGTQLIDPCPDPQLLKIMFSAAQPASCAHKLKQCMLGATGKRPWSKKCPASRLEVSLCRQGPCGHHINGWWQAVSASLVLDFTQLFKAVPQSWEWKQSARNAPDKRPPTISRANGAWSWPNLTCCQEGSRTASAGISSMGDLGLQGVRFRAQPDRRRVRCQ